jgi:NAD(P)-dependent dehydrogenase (short-subunit alcohol dehydrogenase family)
MEIDLSLPESPERLLDAATERLGSPSILVNNAAHSTRDGFENLDASTLDAHYAVNVRAMALLSARYLATAMRQPSRPDPPSRHTPLRGRVRSSFA